jgi:hypothetical protein
VTFLTRLDPFNDGFCLRAEQCYRLFVKLSTVPRYCFGSASAIREVAADGGALWTGIFLVILTGIARNYDQNYVLETPMWLIGPLVFSFFSGSFVYWLVIRCFGKRHFRARPEGQWRSFMALFWMTAPIAWLYAIPVERIFDSYRAAEANLTLLAIVSLWRVLLMSRVVSVLLNVQFMGALGWVLVAACLEVIVVVFVGQIFSPAFGRRVMAGMSGMRNAPEENLLISAMNNVWAWSWVVLFLGMVFLGLFRYRGAAQPLPKPAPGKIPWIGLAALTAVWITIAIPAQLEQQKFVTHVQFVQSEKYSEALAYLSRFQKSDFPVGRRLEPNPYEYHVWQALPPTIALLTTNTPVWIRDIYLSHATIVLSHHFVGYRSLTNVALMFSAIEGLPEGRDWLRTNQVALGQQRLRNPFRGEDSIPVELNARTNIVSTLRRMGMAETNLTLLVE